MTEPQNPAPRVNAEGRGDSKVEQRQHKGFEGYWKPHRGRARPGHAEDLRNSTRKSGRIDFTRINAAALVNLGAICRRLLPNGRREGNEFVALNPRRNDHNLGSFKINLRSGVWCDFASGDRGGDPVSLVAFIEGCRQSEAALKLARMLGLDAGGRRHG
jgi:hypothetical protein